MSDMHRLLFDGEILRELKTAIREAKGSVAIAVPYWGSGALESIGLTSNHVVTKSLRGRLRVICNLSSGACNPREMKPLLSLKASLKTNGYLHAKVIISDTKLIVGSANMSTNGLWFEGDELRGLKEAVILSESEGLIRQARKWFDDLFVSDSSKMVTCKLLTEWQEAWDRNRRRRPISASIRPRKTSPGLVEALDAGLLDNRSIFLTWYEPVRISEEAETYEEEIGRRYENREFIVESPTGGDPKFGHIEVYEESEQSDIEPIAGRSWIVDLQDNAIWASQGVIHYIRTVKSWVVPTVKARRIPIGDMTYILQKSDASELKKRIKKLMKLDGRTDDSGFLPIERVRKDPPVMRTKRVLK